MMIRISNIKMYSTAAVSDIDLHNQIYQFPVCKLPKSNMLQCCAKFNLELVRFLKGNLINSCCEFIIFSY